MVRPSQRKKVKNPHSKVSRRSKNRYNISFAGVHPLVKAHWDKSLTLRQNYERMGLLSALNGKAGGEAEMNHTIHNDSMQSNTTSDLSDSNITIEYKSFEEFQSMPSVGVSTESKSNIKPKSATNSNTNPNTSST